MTENHPSQQAQPQSAPVLSLEVWGATDKGRVREGNEDSVYPHSGSKTFPFAPGPERLGQKGQLLIVADGVGGAKAGSEASRWAIRIAAERYYDMPGLDLGADLRAAIEVANSSLHQYLQSTGAREAGSTMAAAVIHRNILYVANVGDSRIYLLREGQISQLTRDHTLTQRKLVQGLIKPEQVELDPDRSVLTRSMGAGSTVQVDLFPPQQILPGDVVLLCSDGVTDMLGDGDIARLLQGNAPKRAVPRLIAAANKRGGFDNISVIVARVGGGKKPPAGGGLPGKLLNNFRQMSRQQQTFLFLLAALVLVVLCALAALGWQMHNKNNGTLLSTTAPPATATVEIMSSETPVPGDESTPVTPTEATAAPVGKATSTLMPTNTPTSTPTRRPPRPTDTPTPTITATATSTTAPGPGPDPNPQPQPTPPPKPTTEPPPP
ncbi:MAG: protein phosphatase 2C domain-containing protein [Chloroflexota bacterium]|nr:protein phosphatase 2C domain-containing protein [Chloroflexota bacterium]